MQTLKSAEKDERLQSILFESLGQDILKLMADNDVVEIMLNEDGKLWTDRLSIGRTYTDKQLAAHDAERIIRVIASNIGEIRNESSPRLAAEIKHLNGARFQGMLPPVVVNPIFAIRKKATKIFTLKDYIDKKIISKETVNHLKEAIKKKRNILVAGGTGSGKTTLVNALLAEVANYNDRVLIIEDTQELQCAAEDCVRLRSKEGIATMQDLLKDVLRLRPDRIMVGEVRGGEALTLLKSWNTGHNGGIATIHSNGSGCSALYRLEQLIQEAIENIPRVLISEAIDVIVYIERYRTSRRINNIVEVQDFKDDSYVIKEIIKS